MSLISFWVWLIVVGGVMLPRVQPYQNSSGGDTNSGLFEDIGTRSLQTVRVGESAGKASSGTANTFVGCEAGKNNAAGSYDTFIGYQAGSLNAAASYSTMIGAYAGRANQRGSECVMIGYRAGELNNDGQSIVAVGAYAMRENVSGLGTVAVGYRAAERNLDGDYNTLVGAECAQDNRSGNMNTMCGYRSGRANFRGSENTYVGSYSGYSNRDGSANTLIGYKCGENIEFGELNVAIGAYAFRNASHASCNVVLGPYAGANTVAGVDCVVIGKSAGAFNTHGSENVIIGTEAGESNMSGKNVIIGYHAGQESAATASVIIGTDAGVTAGGCNSVIIGYESAKSFHEGGCNVFVGYGADAYLPSLSYGIAIGTFNTFTNEHAISIGEEIYNQRAYSILMGFGIQSDANNSVLMGNNINIQSVIFFKDPLNYLLRNTVANDAFIKLGIDRISYGFSNQLLISPAPDNTIYNYAIAGLITSNIENSTTNRLVNRVSPETFDMRTVFKPLRTAIVQGETLTIRDSNVLTSNIERYYWEFWGIDDIYNDESLSSLLPTSNIILHMNDLVSNHTCNISIKFPPNVVAKNILHMGKAFIEDGNLEIYVVKRVKAPKLAFSECNIVLTETFLDFANLSQPLFTIASNMIQWDDYGIEGSNLGRVVVAVEQPPVHVKLDKGLYDIGDTISCILFRDQAYAPSDVFTIRPILQITDVNGNQYGRPGPAVQITLNFHESAANTKLHTPDIYNCSNIALKPTDVFRIPNTYSLDDPVFFGGIFGSNAYITYSNVTYTSNDLAVMYQEDVFGSFHASNFGSNVGFVSSNIEFVRADNVDYYAYTLQPSIQYFVDYGIQSNIYGFTNLAYEAQELINISVASSNTSYLESLQSKYEGFNSNVQNWAIVYDIIMTSSNQDVNETSNVINTVYSNASVIQSTYDSYPWSFVGSNINLISSDVIALSHSLHPNRIGLSNLIAATSNLLNNSYPFVSLEILLQQLEWLDYKYFQIKRFPAFSYRDIATSQIRLTCPETVQPAFSLTVADTDTINISTRALGKSVKWDSCPFTQITTNVLHMNAIYFPQLQCEELIPATYPIHGVYDQQNRSYTSFNPFAANDVVHLVATSNELSESINWRLNYVFSKTEPVIYAPVYKYDLDDELSISNVYRETSSNVISLWDTYTITLLDEITHYTSNYTYKVSLKDKYDPAKGYSETTSNVSTSNSGWVVTSASDSNNGVSSVYVRTTYTYTHSNYNSNLFDYQQYTSEYIQSFSSNETGYNSNLVYFSNITEDVKRIKAYDIINNVIDSDYQSWNFYSAHNSNYFLYTSNTTVKLRDEASNVSIDSMYIAATSSNAYDINHRFTASSNIVVYEPLYLLHRNAIFSSNGVFSCSSNYVVASNTGPVTSFTQADIDAGRIGLRLSRITNNTSIALGPSNVTIKKLDELIPCSNMTYDAAITLTSGPSTTIPTVFRPSRYDIASNFDPDKVHIISSQYGYFPSGLTSPLANVNDYIYTSTSNYEYDIIKFVFSSNNVATTPITCKVNFLRYSYYDRQYFNIGVSTEDTSLISYTAFNWKDASGIITITSAPDPSIATISPTQFTIPETVKVNFTSNAPVTITYNTASTTNNQFQLIPYVHYGFPRSYAGDEITLYQYANDNTGIHNHIDTNSPLWSFVTNLKYQGTNVDTHDIIIQIIDEITSGFLWNITSRQDRLKSFPLYHLLNDHIHFIPYNPAYAPNINVRIVVLYSDIVSPVYNITLANLYSRFQNSAVSVSSRLRPTIQNVATSSAGFVSKGLSWAPSQFIVPYIASNIPPTIDFPIDLVASGNHIGTYTYSKYVFASSAEIAWSATSMELSLDQADRVSLKPLLNLINVATTSNIQNIYLYITQRPLNGIIQNTSNIFAEAAIRFTDNDLKDGVIFYQHFGSSTTYDVFKVAISTTPYDVAFHELTVRLNVAPIPRITSNVVTYVYYDTVTSALATPNPFAPSNLAVGGWSGVDGYVHFLNKNLLTVRNVLRPSSNIETCRVSDFASTAFYISHIPQSSPYPRMGMDIVCNNQSNAGSYNYLIDYHQAYANALKYPFDVYLNYYVSSNVITNNSQNRYQTLQYDLNAANLGYSNLIDHVVTYFIQVQPQQDLMPSQFQNPAGSEVLRKFGFTIGFEDVGGSNILNMSFNHNGVAIQTRDTSGFYEYSSGKEIVFGKWNNILFINDDTDNKRHASLYIGYNNTVSKQVNVAQNILLNSAIGRLNFNALARIKVSVDIESSVNYVSGPSSNFVVAGNGSNYLDRNFNLTHYGTSLNFRNQEIYTSTYSLDDPNMDIQSTNVHNVVVGKNIIVRGTNNICLGNKFNTSGQYSIVIGNEVGTGDDQGQINELYQCIIIGNQSFANSITRDIIAIGNNNFNALNTLPPEVINTFLSTKPIILGNDISETSIDFTINIGNVFLKTVLGGQQIYLGKSEEPVGIGFTSNCHIHPDYNMHVRGSAAIGKVTTPYWSSNNQYIPPHCPVIYSDDVGDGYVALATEYEEPCVIGICDACLHDVTSGLYKVYVQHVGVADITVDNVTRGDFIYTSNAGICSSSSNVRNRYTIGKALRTGSNIVPCILTI